MADQQIAKQAPRRISDELVAAGILVPFREMKWEDVPRETRMWAMRFFLDVAQQRRAEIVAANAAELKAA
jgi:hypothetical protein